MIPNHGKFGNKPCLNTIKFRVTEMPKTESKHNSNIKLSMDRINLLTGNLKISQNKGGRKDEDEDEEKFAYGLVGKSEISKKN